MSPWNRIIAGGIMAVALACSTSFAVATEAPPPTYDYTNWQSVDFTSPDPGAETFIRSYTETSGGTLSNDIIESFWIGGDGYMYVNVVVDSAFVGSFRYALTPEEPVTYPPSGEDWTPPPGEQFYHDIPGVPEPDAIALALAGLALVGWQWQRGRKAHRP